MVWVSLRHRTIYERERVLQNVGLAGERWLHRGSPTARATCSKVAGSPKSPLTYDSRAASRAKTSSSVRSPQPSIALRAWSRRSSTDHSFTATPTIGQFRSPRRSRRYSEWKVMTFARSPVIPRTTNTSATPADPLPSALAAVPGRLPTAGLIDAPLEGATIRLNGHAPHGSPTGHPPMGVHVGPHPILGRS